MRLNQPRIAPLHESEWSMALAGEFAALARRGQVLNINRTMMRRPEAAIAFRPWATYIYSGNSLPPRLREIIILRTGFLCRAGYEWAQHVKFGAQAGLTEHEIEAIKKGAEEPLWDAAERAVLQMADDLQTDKFVSEPTWALLEEHLDEAQRIDAILTAGQYTAVSMLLNSLGVQLDDDLELDPDLDFRSSAQR